MKRIAWLFILAVFAQAAWAEGQSVAISAEPEYQPYPAVRAVAKERRVGAALIRHVELPGPASAVVEKVAAPARFGVPQQVGFGRDVAELADGLASVARMNWTVLPSGARAAAFSVTSPDAAAIRVGLRARAIPAATLLRFYAPDAGTVHEVTAEELQETIGRNLKAGDTSPNALVFWSPAIEGATAVVEIELPAGATPAQLDLAAPQISHLVTSPSSAFTMAATKVAAASCNNDVMCYAAAWNTESSAVARMLFTDAGASYYCTGTLLSDLDTSTTIPYFLTANHCIDNQAAASTLETYWFLRSPACNAAGTSASATDLTGGAVLLYSSTKTDTALLLLSKTPPGGAMYAGWSVGSTPAVSSSVTVVHHPEGDRQKISFGNIASYATCTQTSSDSFSCREAAATGATFMEVTWNSGITEPGSSGSALFTSTGHYVIGQLYGGTTSCTKQATGSDFFGRFDAAFTAGLSKYLAPSNSGNTAPASGSTGSGVTPLHDYSALWWNPSESGWGINITQHDSRIFAAWYVYGPSGTPTWVIMSGGTWTSPTSVTGQLYATTGPPSTVAFNPAAVKVNPVGAATITFSAVDQAVLSYTVNGVSGTKAIQRQDFGVPDATPVASYQDLWWTASESGWGMSIDQQYRTLFSVIYTYGTTGQPVWYVMPGGAWTGPTVYSGPLYATSMPSFNYYSSAFNPANVTIAPVGTISLDFSSTSTATLTFTVNGQAFTKSITRESF